MLPKLINEEYFPSEDEEYMCDQHLEYFKNKLIKWKDDLIDESLKTLSTLRDKNLNEPDANYQATVEADVAMELRTRDRARKLIQKIDEALDRISEKIYGFCEATGEPIGLKRLMARPVATLSIEAQEYWERYEKQHSEV